MSNSVVNTVSNDGIWTLGIRAPTSTATTNSVSVYREVLETYVFQTTIRTTEIWFFIIAI